MESEHFMLELDGTIEIENNDKSLNGTEVKLLSQNSDGSREY